MLSVMSAIGLLAWSTFKFGVPPAPTLPHVGTAVLDLIPVDAKHIAELGAGWGGMTKAIANARPNAKVVAYERSWLPYMICKLRGIDVRREDFFQTDLAAYDTVYCYLTPELMARLGPKLEDKRVVSNAFPIPNRSAAKTLTVGRLPAITVYCYA